MAKSYNATPSGSMQPPDEDCNRLQHTGLEPGCIGIKIRVLSHPTHMNPVFMWVFRIQTI